MNSIAVSRWPAATVSRSDGVGKSSWPGVSASAAPRRPDFHPDPEYIAQITSVRWIVLHLIEETATHSGHLEIARELLDGKIGITGR
jgi:hypothetical protein